MMLWMTSWILGLHCRAHILSLAISWGVHAISEKEILDNIFLGIRGLLLSGYALDHKVSAMANSSVVYRGLPDEETEEDVRFFWTLLLGDSKHLDLFVWAGPFWYDDRLHVNARVRDHPDRGQRLDFMIKQLLRWRLGTTIPFPPHTGFLSARWISM